MPVQPENTGAFLLQHPQHLHAPRARPAPRPSSNEAAAEPCFATPYRHGPGPLGPVQVQLLPPRLRRTQGPSRAQSQLCVGWRRGGKAGVTGSSSHLPGSHQNRPSRRSSAFAPPTRGELRAWPLPLHPPPQARVPLPRARARGVQPRPVPESPGRSSAAPRPPPPSSALRLQIPASHRVPGTAKRGPAAQSALTWKCSAIFPGGGAGRRSREPEGREGKRAPRKPQPPAGSLRRSLARSSPGPRGLAFEALDGAGPGVRGGAMETARAGRTREGRGLGARNPNCPLHSFQPLLPQVNRDLSLQFCDTTTTTKLSATILGSYISHRRVTPNPCSTVVAHGLPTSTAPQVFMSSNAHSP